ncbi:MAG: hypothetical protein AB7N70_19210 [Dehalococcoidia bacterium]
MDRLGWTATALDRLLAESDYPSMLLISALANGDEEPSEETLTRLTPVVAQLSDPSLGAAGLDADGDGDGIRECRSEADAAQGVLCSMERLVPVVPPVLARDVTEEGARLLAALSPSPHAGFEGLRTSRAATAPAADPLQSFAEDALEGVWTRRKASLAADEPSSIDGVLAGMLGFAPAEGASALVRAPALSRLVGAYPLAGAGSPGVLGGGVDEGYRAFLGGVSASLGAALRGPAAGEGISAVPLGFGLATEPPTATAEWAAGRAYVYLATRSAALGGADGSTTQRMAALGAAAVDLRRGTASFPASLAGMGRDLAVAALTGNVLGFASRITSFFQGSPLALGGSAGRDVGVLREGIESLRGEMRVGFADVNERIDTLFGVLDDRFARLQRLAESSARDTRSELTALHDEVLALGDRMERMDAGTRSYVQAGFDRDYSRTLVRCLEHRNRYVPPFDEMEFGVFADCLADFRTRAVVDATDALLADRSTLVDDASVVTALARQSPSDLAYRLPLLARIAEQRFHYPALGGERSLANLSEWMVAASAYLALLDDWPLHARAVNERDLEAMRALGADLGRTLRAITVDPATGLRSPLFDRVLAYYEERLDELIDEADTLARRHRQQILLQVDPETLFVDMQESEGAGPALHVPGFIAASVPAEIRTAAVLGVDDVSIEYRMEREDSVSRSATRHRFLFFGRRHDRHTHSRVHVVLELRSGDLGTVARWRTAGPFVLTRTEEMKGDHTSVDVAKRVDHVGDVLAHFLTASWPALAADADLWTRDLVNQEAVPTLERRIEDELRRHATAGLDGVFNAICAADAAPGTLSTQDIASATRMRRALTGMSAARALIEAYARLAFPDALTTDTQVRDALLGDDALLDRTSLCDVVASGESGLRRVWLDEEPVRRLELLRAGIDELLVPAWPSAQPTLVDGVLERLDSAIRVQRLRARVATAG